MMTTFVGTKKLRKFGVMAGKAQMAFLPMPPMVLCAISMLLARQ